MIKQLGGGEGFGFLVAVRRVRILHLARRRDERFFQKRHVRWVAHRRGKGYMETTARPMDTLKATLNDKTVLLQTVKVRGEGEEDGEGEGEGMTLDVMVTCEVCGHHQRVGKRR